MSRFAPRAALPAGYFDRGQNWVHRAAEKGVWLLFVSFTPERVPKTGPGGLLVFGVVWCADFGCG